MARGCDAAVRRKHTRASDRGTRIHTHSRSRCARQMTDTTNYPGDEIEIERDRQGGRDAWRAREVSERRIGGVKKRVE